MKRFLFWLFLILIVSGVVFFFGWTQYDLDRDMYGVVYTRTAGYAEEPIESGSFSWSGWALIPKNLQITQVPSSSRRVDMHISDELPSADIYRMMSLGDPQFSYAADIAVSYSIAKDAVVDLVRRYGLDEHNSINWFLAKDQMVRSVAGEYLQEYFRDLESAEDRERMADGIEGHLMGSLRSYFTELDISEVTVTFTGLPDFELYTQARESYEEMVNLKNETLAQAIAEAPGTVTENMLYLDKLQNFGLLLTQYPVLLEYLRIEQDMP